MTRNATAATDDFASDLAALRTDVARLSDALATLLTAQAQEGGQRLATAAGEARDMLSATAAQLKGRVDAAGGEIEAHIERHPLAAMLVSFGIGMALGMLSRPRR